MMFRFIAPIEKKKSSEALIVHSVKICKEFLFIGILAICPHSVVYSYISLSDLVTGSVVGEH